MGSGYGRQSLESVGTSISTLAHLDRVGWKPGGITFDWGTVTAVSGADVSLEEGMVVPIGDKYVRYGTVVAKITASGKFGPYKSDAADGRQTLVRGECFILNHTILESDLASDYEGVFDEGLVFKARLVIGSGTNPSLADFLTAFPGIRFVVD